MGSVDRSSAESDSAVFLAKDERSLRAIVSNGNAENRSYRSIEWLSVRLWLCLLILWSRQWVIKSVGDNWQLSWSHISEDYVIVSEQRPDLNRYSTNSLIWCAMRGKASNPGITLLWSSSPLFSTSIHWAQTSLMTTGQLIAHLCMSLHVFAHLCMSLHLSPRYVICSLPDHFITCSV